MLPAVGGAAKSNFSDLKKMKKLDKQLERKVKNSAKQLVFPLVRGLANKTPVSTKGRGQVGFTQSNWGIKGEGISYRIRRSLGPNKQTNAATLNARHKNELQRIKQLGWKLSVRNETPAIYHLNAGSRSPRWKGYFDKHFRAFERRSQTLIKRWFKPFGL